MAARTGRTNGATTRTTPIRLVSEGPSGGDPTALEPPAEVMTVPSRPAPSSSRRGCRSACRGWSTAARATPAPPPRPSRGTGSPAAPGRSPRATVWPAGPGGAGRRSARGLGGNVGRVAEAFQHGADTGLGLGGERGPGGGDVLADLVEQLLAAVGRQVAGLALQVLEM